MALPRPITGNTAQTLNVITALCDAVDNLLSAESSQDATVAALQGSLAAEVQGRVAAIAALTNAFNQRADTESEARVYVDTIEKQDRTSADTALSSRLDSAVQQLQAAVQGQGTTLGAAIATVRSLAEETAAVLAQQRLEFALTTGRPGDAPLRYTFVLSSSSLGGGRDSLPFVPDALLANGDRGRVLRVLGPGIVAARVPSPIEVGRLYRTRYVLQRRVNPADPTGDASICGLVYLDQSLRVLGDIVPVRTYPALITANGRQECEALISASPGLGAPVSAPFHPPAAARFMLPVVALYGPDGMTDVEVLAIDDVTGAFVLDPPSTDAVARISALEAASLPERVEALESEAGTPSKITFASKGDASYATIPATVQVVELLGRTYAGDGGGGLYQRTAVEPEGVADFFKSHGAVFERVAVAQDVATAVVDSALDGLPTTPPPLSGQRWNNGGLISVTP